MFNYILLIMLLELSWFFPLCPSLPRIPHTLRQSPHLCSCPCIMCVSSLATPFPILYFTSPWLLCNYLFDFFFQKICFIDYAITVVPFFSPLYSALPCTHPHHHSPTLVHVHGSYKFLGFSISYTILFFFFQFLNYFIVVHLQLSAFSPHPSTQYYS